MRDREFGGSSVGDGASSPGLPDCCSFDLFAVSQVPNREKAGIEIEQMPAVDDLPVVGALLMIAGATRQDQVPILAARVQDGPGGR